jgi:hypothetical protein
MRRLLLPALALAAAACGAGPDAPSPDPVRLLERSRTAMAAVETASFEMTRAGAPVTIEGFEFSSAVGRYAAPASAEAVLRVKAGDITVEMGTISVNERTWLTNPLTGRWEELTPGTGFNPAVLFDPETGWTALLADLTDVSLIATERGTHHLTGTIPGERVNTLTAGIAEAQSVLLHLWVDSSTGLIRRLELSTTGEAGASDWVLVLSDYGEPVQIEPPVAE